MSETTASAARTTSTARSKGARISLRALQIVLALFYAFASALPKLIAHPSAVESFDTLGWGSAGMYTIGALELAGAIGLLIPALASVAAVSLGALMVGAFITQITAFDGEYAATPLILVVPLGLIAWTRRQDLAGPAQWVRRVRREA
ncbi:MULTISPECIES: DoxX family protein [Streptomyces]|uniref:Putative membrane protein YphA (DoxX/SURF4 family) n=2 Tax=Streptomyces stelliscabiei TaxID=146820 RepID=A0A8I0TQW0_9ACTN|nr:MULTISPECIES: DoxX family protein [Streptomyces]MBE1596301.1 putative membrane protein YphA (DoxX/SURF4 family) [Streptomyces stelliscabiei]MDX2518113.1 DoxX family protein [Streptomyces stelliscabiei]MDX2555733.1 DoxX family protein [Streptomyces stelliscabiei]MDX2614280.1 DoxX family protein [Streptomyces stelliscabiei]MDX2633582.1 DoxX family protein [Streptomyces stelliscabiei]